MHLQTPVQTYHLHYRRHSSEDQREHGRGVSELVALVLVGYASQEELDTDKQGQTQIRIAEFVSLTLPWQTPGHTSKSSTAACPSDFKCLIILRRRPPLQPLSHKSIGGFPSGLHPPKHRGSR
jgi:hypothetical protein